MIIYINGRKATRADLRALWQRITDGRATATTHRTNAGALAYTVIY